MTCDPVSAGTDLPTSANRAARAFRVEEVESRSQSFLSSFPEVVSISREDTRILAEQECFELYHQNRFV